MTKKDWKQEILKRVYGHILFTDKDEPMKVLKLAEEHFKKRIAIYKGQNRGEFLARKSLEKEISRLKLIIKEQTNNLKPMLETAVQEERSRIRKKIEEWQNKRDKGVSERQFTIHFAEFLKECDKE